MQASPIWLSSSSDEAAVTGALVLITEGGWGGINHRRTREGGLGGRGVPGAVDSAAISARRAAGFLSAPVVPAKRPLMRVPGI